MTPRIAYLHRVQCQIPIPRRATDRATWQVDSGMGSMWLQQGSWIPPGRTQAELLPLPWGAAARLLLAAMHARWLQTGRADIAIGGTRGEVMAALGIEYDSSRRWRIVRDQALALSACTIHMQSAHLWSTDRRMMRICAAVADLGRHLVVELAPEYCEYVADGMIPIDLAALAALRRSPIAMDVYAWLTERLHRIPAGSTVRIPSTQLRAQLGPEYSRTDHFVRDLTRALADVLTVYPAAARAIEIGRGVVRLRHAAPAVPRRSIPVQSRPLTLPP